MPRTSPSANNRLKLSTLDSTALLCVGDTLIPQKIKPWGLEKHQEGGRVGQAGGRVQQIGSCCGVSGSSDLLLTFLQELGEHQGLPEPGTSSVAVLSLLETVFMSLLSCTGWRWGFS